MNKKIPFRVLCLDGGGMRGLYTAIFLDTLTKRLREEKVDIGKAFDLIVGTSTGGILASGLALGVPIGNIIKLYVEHGPAIFINPKNFEGYEPRDIFFSWLEKIGIPTPVTAEMRRGTLQNALEEQFGETTIGDIWKEREIALCIPAVNMATKKAWVFKTPHITKGQDIKNRDKGYKLVDICLATSAAPTLFPLVAVDDPDKNGNYQVFADGGLWANDPSLVGLIEALEITENKLDIQIISVSTASPPKGEAVERGNVNFPIWGDDGWAFGKKIIEMCFESQTSAIEFQLKFLLPHLRASVDYIRLASSAPSANQGAYIGLDKADDKAIKALMDMAKHDVENNTLGIASKHSKKEVTLLKEIVQDMPIFQPQTSNHSTTERVPHG